MDNEKAKKILEHFKESLFISTSIEKFKVKPYDFFEFIKNSDELTIEYKKIDNFNNYYKEEQIAEKVYTSDFSKTILLEMIKSNNKAKYNKNDVFEDENDLSGFTDDELEERIKQLQGKK